jgi:hypothetical protein
MATIVNKMVAVGCPVNGAAFVDQETKTVWPGEARLLTSALLHWPVLAVVEL